MVSFSKPVTPAVSGAWARARAPRRQAKAKARIPAFLPIMHKAHLGFRLRDRSADTLPGQRAIPLSDPRMASIVPRAPSADERDGAGDEREAGEDRDHRV